MTPLQYGKDLFAKAICLADVFEESALNDIFTKCFDESICHGLRKLWSSNCDVDLTDSAFETQEVPAPHTERLEQTNSANSKSCSTETGSTPWAGEEQRDRRRLRFIVVVLSVHIVEELLI